MSVEQIRYLSKDNNQLIVTVMEDHTDESSDTCGYQFSYQIANVKNLGDYVYTEKTIDDMIKNGGSEDASYTDIDLFDDALENIRLLHENKEVMIILADDDKNTIKEIIEKFKCYTKQL